MTLTLTDAEVRELRTRIAAVDEAKAHAERCHTIAIGHVKNDVVWRAAVDDADRKRLESAAELGFWLAERMRAAVGST